MTPEDATAVIGNAGLAVSVWWIGCMLWSMGAGWRDYRRWRNTR